MGYYNDVVLSIAPEAADSFYPLLSSDQALYDLVMKGSESFDTSKFRKGDILIEWYGVKWGDRYPEVAKLNKWRSSLPEEHYRFTRVGEDNNDIEENGDYGWDYIQVTRPQIEIQIPAEPDD